MREPNQTLVDREVMGKGHRFIVFFLCDDEDQTVHVGEVEEIDFSGIFQHLSLGGSVFILIEGTPGAISVLEQKARRNAM